MKAIVASIVALAFAVPLAVLAAPSEAEMQRCFEKHKQLMHKPALMNPRDCWRAHGRSADDKS
jgi:hypothetical protein